MQAHDDPELREQVRRELLYPVKVTERALITEGQLYAIASLHWYKVWSVAGLSARFGIPEEIVRDVVEGDYAAAA